MDFGTIIFYVIGIGLLILVCKLLSFPIKLLWRLLINALIGGVILFLLNLFGGLIGFTIPINIWTALITGILGIPGVLGLVIYFLIF